MRGVVHDVGSVSLMELLERGMQEHGSEEALS